MTDLKSAPQTVTDIGGNIGLLNRGVLITWSYTPYQAKLGHFRPKKIKRINGAHMFFYVLVQNGKLHSWFQIKTAQKQFLHGRTYLYRL